MTIKERAVVEETSAYIRVYNNTDYARTGRYSENNRKNGEEEEEEEEDLV